MTARRNLGAALKRCPLIAILDGITPDEIDPVADILAETGFSIVEIPLDTPDAFRSIERLARRFGEGVLVGGSTVLGADQVATLADCGAALAMSPHCSPGIIEATIARGMISIPGYATPTEAFTALSAGASGLKLFPANDATPATINAHRAILPPGTLIIPVGGMDATGMPAWLSVADGLGTCSSLYQPRMPLGEIRLRARQLTATSRFLQRR